MQIYHHIWLEAHPERSEEWLKDRLKDGFDVHHIDGDHSNDDPKNLALIEASDHMRMHGAHSYSRIRNGPPPSCRSIADMMEQYSYNEIDDLYRLRLATRSYAKVTEHCGLTQQELKKLFKRHEVEKDKALDVLNRAARKAKEATEAPVCLVALERPKPRKRHVPRVRKYEQEVTDEDLAAWLKHVALNVRPQF